MTSPAAAADKPLNILFLMTDQQRPDHVGFLPGSRFATPNLDRLAGSVAFDRCHSVNPVCTPARSALLTGKYTHQIGMLQMSGDLSPQHPTYFQALQRAGYWTAGIGKFHWLQGWPWGTPAGHGHDLVALKDQMKAAYGLDHIWESSGKQLAVPNHCDYAAHLDAKGLLGAYRDHIKARGPNYQQPDKTTWSGEPWPFDEADYVDNQTGDAILRAIDSRPDDQPFCIFGSFCGPHKPYDPPASCLDAIPLDETDDFLVAPEHGPMDAATKERLYRVRRAYRAMIHCVDLQVGRILDTLEARGLLDSTVILFTSDHGEMLGDRNRMSKQQPWDKSLRVPTAIRHPQHLGGALCRAPVELTDLTATMLDVAGLDPAKVLSKPWPAYHDRVPCRSLLPIVRGETESVRDYAFSECGAGWEAVASAEWKYIRYVAQPDGSPARELLYHTATDPDELLDRAAEPACAEVLAAHRAHRLWVHDLTPPAQLQWAPYGPRTAAPAPA